MMSYQSLIEKGALERLATGDAATVATLEDNAANYSQTVARVATVAVANGETDNNNQEYIRGNIPLTVATVAASPVANGETDECNQGCVVDSDSPVVVSDETLAEWIAEAIGPSRHKITPHDVWQSLSEEDTDELRKGLIPRDTLTCYVGCLLEDDRRLEHSNKPCVVSNAKGGGMLNHGEYLITTRPHKHFFTTPI